MEEQPSVRPERTITWRVRRASRQGVHEGEIVVAGEEPLEVRLNGQPIAVLMRLPGDEKELAAGFCLSEGYVRRSDDLLMVHHCGSAALGPDDPLESSNRVEVTARPEALTRSLEMTRLILSGCGSTGSAAAAAQLAADLSPLQSDLRLRQEVLLGLAQALVAAQGVHKQTGGVHAAALFTSTGELLVLREDIGRHNAVDKVLGYALLRHLPLDDKVLLTTGRASHEMVVKAVRVGLPVVASVSSPTSLAVQIASRLNCTLIGYLRGQRMVIYTHWWRVLSPQPM
jgi:FdhD protein